MWNFSFPKKGCLFWGLCKSGAASIGENTSPPFSLSLNVSCASIFKSPKEAPFRTHLSNYHSVLFGQGHEKQTQYSRWESTEWHHGHSGTISFISFSSVWLIVEVLIKLFTIHNQPQTGISPRLVQLTLYLKKKTKGFLCSFSTCWHCIPCVLVMLIHVPYSSPSRVPHNIPSIPSFVLIKFGVLSVFTLIYPQWIKQCLIMFTQ